MNAWQLLLKGGPLMWPILLCSVASLAIFFQKMAQFASLTMDDRSFRSKIFDLLKQNNLKDAMVLCQQNSSPASKILNAGLVKYGSSRDEIKEALEIAAQLEIVVLEKNIPVLTTIIHLAPLLGLLGTVVGLANSFYVIQVRAVAMDPVTPGDIAGGMWQALLTTIFGLIVSIPTMLAHNYCISRVNEFVVEMERTASDLVELLSRISQTNAP